MAARTDILQQCRQPGAGLVPCLLQPIAVEREGEIRHCGAVKTGERGLGECGIAVGERRYQGRQQLPQDVQFGGDRIAGACEAVELVIEVVDPMLEIGHPAFDGIEVAVERRNITHRNSPLEGFVVLRRPILAEMRPGVAGLPAPGRPIVTGAVA